MLLAPLLTVTAVLLLIGLTATFGSGETASGDRFDVDPYLSHVRRWRIAGAVAGCLAGVAAGLAQERVSIGFVPVLAGWFAGAVIAEFRFTAPWAAGRDAVVPRRLLRVPVVLAAATAGVTALVFVLDRAADQWWWCAGALACAAAVRAVNRRVLARPVLAANAIGVTAGVGGALVAWCLAGQLALLGARSFGATVAGIGMVWVIGGLLAARLLATGAVHVAVGGRAEAADGRVETVRGRVATATGRVAVVAAVVVVTSAGWAGAAWWHGHPPYPATAVRATATVRLTDAGGFPRDAGAMGITGLTALLDEPHSQQFIGRVDHAVPAGVSGRDTYHVLVIDKRRNRLAPQMYDAQGGGWNGFLSELADRYPWLSATADIRTGGGYRSPGLAVSTAADVRGPITFAGRFSGVAGLSAADLMVVLVLTGPDQQIYWASRISG